MMFWGHNFKKFLTFIFHFYFYFHDIFFRR